MSLIETDLDLVAEFPNLFYGLLKTMRPKNIHHKPDSVLYCSTKSSHNIEESTKKELKITEMSDVTQRIVGLAEWCLPVLIALK